MEKSQHGIGKGKSCLPDLLGSRKVLVSTQIKSIVSMIQLDFQKVFSQYCTLEVTESMLMDREQIIFQNGKDGVLQGQVLGLSLVSMAVT